MMSTLLTFSLLVLSTIVSLSSARPFVKRDGSKMVFAHYMVGLTDGQSFSQWQTDISNARSVGIDGFALNMGPVDSWNSDQLSIAYQAAGQYNDFYLFLSFDMSGTTWAVGDVIGFINDCKGKSAQYKVGGLPFVSTFEGTVWPNWPDVRTNTGGIFFVPDWSSLGAYGVQQKLSSIDGAFSWDAWPQANSKQMYATADNQYMSILGGKPYMMGVSPYFYTDLQQWNKNWYCTSDTLWFDRWQQVFQVNPQYIEIITWNDYGESSYINNPVASQIVSGAGTYVNGYDHSGFLFPLKYFISAFKAGTTDVSLPQEGAVAWYRLTPAQAASDGGTVWGQYGTQSAMYGTTDEVTVLALLNSQQDITISIGGNPHTVSPSNSFGKAYLYTLPFNGQTGQVTVTVNGKSTSGPAISSYPSSGQTNFNAVTITV